MNIHKITSEFNFEGIDLEEPKSLQGGSAYSVPIRYNNEVLLLQTQTCKCKSGFIINGRKTYIDLVFTDKDTYFLNWIDSLEESLQKKIFEKSSEWFENSLTEDDVETSFLSLLKPQKNRTRYILRCYVHNLTNFNIGVKIYDEAGNDLATKDITPDVNIACILSLQDIKFSSKNFQVFINVKQILVFRDLEKDRMLLLEKPIVEESTPPLTVPGDDNSNEPVTPAPVPPPAVPVVVDNSLSDLSDIQFNNPSYLEENKDKTEVVDSKESNLDDSKESELDDSKESNLDDSKESNLDDSKELELDDSKESNLELDDSKELELELDNIEELELELDNIEELELDDSKELELDNIEELELDNIDELEVSTNDTGKYIELYNKAREKAELAKKEALDAFLEANNIKKKYNLK